MKHFRLGQSKAWWVLLAYLLISTGGSVNGVLCFGLDGHIALEFTGLGGCGPESVDGSGSTTLSLAASENGRDHCGPCVDVPILANASDNSIASVKQPGSQQRVPLATPVTTAAREITAVKSVPLRQSAVPSVSATLLFLRTVVLRI